MCENSSFGVGPLAKAAPDDWPEGKAPVERVSGGRSAHWWVGWTFDSACVG